MFVDYIVCFQTKIYECIFKIAIHIFKILLTQNKCFCVKLLHKTDNCVTAMCSGFSWIRVLSVLDPAKRMRGVYGYIGLFGVILLSISVALKLLGVL